MRDFLKRVAIGVAVGLSLFFLKGKVFAAELASTSGYRVTYSTGTANSSNTTCTFSGSISNSGLVTAGTGWSNSTSGSCLYVRSVGINVQTPADTSKQFEPGIQYSLKLLWNFNPRPVNLAFDDTITPQIYNGSSYVNSALVQITSWSSLVASDNYGVYITINFTVTSRQRYINFIIIPLNMSVSPNFYLFRYYQQGFNLKNFELSESNDAVVNSIDNQTAIIQAGFTSIINSIFNNNQEILDTDVNVTDPYGNDYSTDDYDDANDDLHGWLTQNAGNTFSFDFSTWGNVFSWIFGKLTDLVQLNPKVFVMITGYLTFSFVGLVFNR